MTEKSDNQKSVLNEIAPHYGVDANGDIDLPLLRDNLAKTPWERMQANDDAVNFGNLLRTAMKNRIAKLNPPRSNI